MRYLGVVAEALLLVFAIIALFWFGKRQHALTPLASLPIPFQKRITFSGPLDLRHHDMQILGVTVEVDPNDIIKASNRRRQEAGIPPLRTNDKLMRTAQLRADVIVRQQNFSHSDPYEGIELATVLPRFGYYYSFAAENIGLGGVSAEDFIAGFFNSPSHKKTILDRQLIETGVGVARGTFNGWETLVVVQHFAIPTTKKTWYGYGEEDIEYYQQLLSSIDVNLANTDRWLSESGGKSSYYRGWKEILERQKEIIDTLLLRMHADEPLSQQERNLIYEYNNNWNKAPKK